MERFIKNYKILREIGKGGMGIVYKALNIETQKTYAIKVLPANMVDRSTVERFTREAQAMARLRHPNLVAVLDMGMTEGQHYYVMEFIDGETVRSLIKEKGALSLDVALKIILKTADALNYTHGEGIIHRDVKPGNIMVTKEGLVKLMDFGLVKIPGVTKVTGSGSTVGTAEYMSPEQIYGEEIDTRSDIYSLGVTIYEMLTGEVPFKADTLQATLMKHKYEPPPPLRNINPQIPEEIERIVMKALSKNVSTRYQKVQELIDDIHKFKGVKSQEEPKEKAAFSEGVDKSKVIKEIISGLIFLGVIALCILGIIKRAEVYEFFLTVSSNIHLPFLKEGDDLIKETKHDLNRINIADKHYHMGLKYYKSGDFENAISEYKKAISLRKDYGAYYRDLALAYEKQGNPAKAVEALNELLKNDRSGSFAEGAIRHMERLKN